MILSAEGGVSKMIFAGFFAAFPLLGAICLIGEHVRQFLWILAFWEAFLHVFFYNFIALFLANAIAFCGQDSGRNRQDFGKMLAGAAKILSNSLHIREHQECSGVRRSSRKRTTIIIPTQLRFIVLLRLRCCWLCNFVI